MVAIALQVGNMCVSIKQFDELTKTLSAQDMEIVGKWYTTYVFITLRRLVDNDKDAISFARLLRDLTQKTGLLTRARYCDMFWDRLRTAPAIFAQGAHVVEHTPGMLHVRFQPPDRATADAAANAIFDELAGTNDETIKQSIIKDDRKSLIAACKPFKDWANQWVAHLGDPNSSNSEHKVKPWEFPDHKMVEECVRFLDKLTDKYYRLLIGFPFTPKGSLAQT